MNQIPVKFQWLGILCLWLLGPRSLLLAQQRVQVVTKTVEKQFDYQPGETLRLEGEKAAITVTGWQGKEVKVILKLIAKAPAQETARRELDFQRYILEKRKEVIHLKNYFVLPKGQKALHAILLAEYEVWVPYQATIAITNTYGNVQVTKKGGRTHIDLKYGNTTLAEVEGVGHYNSYFGDFTAKNISGATRGRLQHTKTSIEGLAGEANFENTLSDIRLGGLHDVKSLSINASKSDVSLSVAKPEQYQYRFRTEFGEITPPGKETGRLVKNSAGLVTWERGVASLPLITVKTTFGNITLETP